MCDPADSSQIKAWLFSSNDLLLCRSRANGIARKHVSSFHDRRSKETTDDENPVKNAAPTECFARDFATKKKEFLDEDLGQMQMDDTIEFLSPGEESLLVSFFCSKLPELIGPRALHSRLGRDSKVPATAAMLLHRFYLSNSIMIHDPKTIMVSAAFLASKVEDAMIDIRYLEEGTNLMDSPVLKNDILPAEVNLLSGTNFELLCFHPYKAILAITEDLRNYLKSEKGHRFVKFSNGRDRKITGQDLIPMHADANKIVDDAIISDLPLLYTPGQIGFAALILANEKQKDKENIPQIDLMGYLSVRFETLHKIVQMKSLLNEIGIKLQELREGKHGCSKYNTDMQKLKGVHKKLKKCKTWGLKKKKKKRKNATGADGAEDEHDKKRIKAP